MTRIGVAEDQKMFRKGLVMLLNSFEGMEVIYEGENGQELLDQIQNDPPHVAILDYSMPVMGGIETTLQLREKFPDIKIILLSMYDDEEFIEKAIESGANGYLSKEDDLSELDSAIKGVLSNHYYLNDRLSKLFVNRLMNKGKINPKFSNPVVDFNEEEMRILKLISKEFTTQEIADEVNKSIRTIEKYRTRMMEKVGAQNSIGLIMYAIKHKLISI